LIRQPKNLGYGGNQKAGYELAIEYGLDIIVMLHGDGQYAPESIPDIIAPLLAGEADAVFGSRLMVKGAARKGGMPLDKYAGMQIAEVAIPTYYGVEICCVDGLGHAADVTEDVLAYRLQKAGFGDGSRIALNEEHQLKPNEDSSHGRILSILSTRPPSKILDLGCPNGLLAERLRALGHVVVGVDHAEPEG